MIPLYGAYVLEGSRPKQSLPRTGLCDYGARDDFCIFPVPFNFLKNMSLFFFYKKKVFLKRK